MSRFGNPVAVDAVADQLRRGSVAAETALSNVKRAQPSIWKGKAADAYKSAVQQTVSPAGEFIDALQSAGLTLSRYADVQRKLQAEFDQAQKTYDRAKEALRKNPFDVFAGIDLTRSGFAGLSAIGEIQQAAATAAGELQSLSGEALDGKPWWDPFGWFTDKEDIMADDSFDPDDVTQGQIGDCFMLSTVVSLLNTDEGDQFIRDNIRWDPDKEGYWVTLYSNGVPEEVFVEHVFDHGAKQKDWEWFIFSGDKPSIAALYEAALREKYGYDYLEGGVSSDAMAIITGKPVHEIANSNYAGLSESQVDVVREAVNSGGQATISSPRSGTHEITVTAPDGSTREVEIVTSHSYVVTRVEPDGSMWMRNPWGPGNPADGGGEFLVSAEDVSSKFWRAATTNVNE